jgi:hypothetical protein
MPGFWYTWTVTESGSSTPYDAHARRKVPDDLSLQSRGIVVGRQNLDRKIRAELAVAIPSHLRAPILANERGIRSQHNVRRQTKSAPSQRNPAIQ